MNSVLTVENLSKSYGNKKAVSDLCFEIEQGEIFGLLGANGAGKSTTIECILGTKKADSGQVRLFGKDPRAAGKSQFERIGVQFQESHFPEKITVVELCELTKSLYRNSVDYQKLLKDFGLIDKIKRFVSDLSGGERQRLFVVLALIPNPEMVFLDELTTGLDTKARRDVWKHLMQLKQNGLTVLLTSHYMDEIEALCDRILVLKSGEAVFQGTIAEAIAQSTAKNLEEAYLYLSGDEEDTEI